MRKNPIQLMNKLPSYSPRRIQYHRFNDFFNYSDLNKKNRAPARNTYLSGYERRFQQQFVPPLKVMKPIQDQAERYKQELFSVLNFRDFTPLSSRSQIIPLVKLERSPLPGYTKSKSVT